MASGSSDVAQANNGVYPNPPIQTSPLNYAEGTSSVTFSFASYNYFDGYYNGYPDAYYIEVYHGSTLKNGDYVFDTSVTFDGFVPGETYSWRVYAVYDFYDAATGYYEDWDNTYWSTYATFVNIPDDIPSPPALYYPNGASAFAGGKFCNMEWQDSTTIVPNTGYAVDVARDSNFNSIIGSEYPESSSVVFTRLPADGSQIYWRVIACNDFGCSDPSTTASFTNDCNRASTGSGSGVTFDTCSDDFTSYGMTDYLLKDISRRGTEEMQPAASIITGLNSDNLRIEAGKLRNTQIVPQQNYSVSWSAAGLNDAVHAQAYSGNFYDYLSVIFRKPGTNNPLYSFDGTGSAMYNQIGGAKCDSGTSAYWNQETWNVHFCAAGRSQNPELVGHEWGHATSTASGRKTILDYYGESGALEEAYADWMGMAFKNEYFGPSWQFGGENFADLSRTPNYYNGNGFDFRKDVWTNSRLPSSMFYLLSERGEHQHPFSKIKVQGIGIENAIQIAFRANMEKWAANVSVFEAANDMFEVAAGNPNVLPQLKNAWAAVGVCTKVALEPDVEGSKKMSCGLPAIIVKTGAGNGSVTSPIETTPIYNSLDNVIYDMQYEPVWGQQVTVVATPQANYEFSNWTEGFSVVPDAGESYTFTADRDRTLTANFKAVETKNFNSVNVGSRSLPQTITISNFVQPPQPVNPGQAQITGAQAGDFLIENNNCTGTMLLANGSCTLQIVYIPNFAGSSEATFSISANAGGQTVLTKTYPLTGSGVITGVSVSSSSTAGGTATISGSQLYGGTALAIATPNPGYAFNGWLENGTIVSSAASYSFVVTGNRSLMAKFTTTPTAIAALPLSGIFGTIPTGQASPVHSFTITNSGQLPLTVISLTLSGLHSAEFSVTGNSCSQPLQPGDTCSGQVSFAPTTAGLKSAMLSITSTDSANPSFVIDLSGYGGTPIMLYKGAYSPDYYNTVQTAYNNSMNGNEIKLWASDFSENLSFNRPVNVSIRGGYNDNFADRPGKTALQGTLTINNGTVIVDGLQLGGSSYRSTLKVVIDTPASGTITSFPSGINCTDSCSSSRLNGDQLTLTATPVGDSTFTGWSGGGCSGTGSCSVTISADVTVTASFSAAKIAVAPASESFGTAYAGISTIPRTITVTSSGMQGLIIGNLSFSGANVSDFTMPADNCSGHSLAPAATCTVQVLFAPLSTGAKTASILIPSNDPSAPVFSVPLNGIGALPTLTVSKSGVGGGTIASSPAGIDCGSACTATFALNATVELSVIPDLGYIFSGWSGACSGSDNCSLTITDNTSVTALFAEMPLASCSANPVYLGGTLHPSIQAAYNAAVDNDIIKLLAIDFTESFTANRPIAVTINGGYKCSFESNPMETVIHGDPDIDAGDVTLTNITIDQ